VPVPPSIFAAAGRTELATERCDLHCAWCEGCRGRDIPADLLRRAWASTLPPGTPVVRIRGGDPFRYGDLDGWVAWGRTQPGVAICIEGPAATLAGADRRAVLARLVAARPDAVSAVLPTVDPERTAALTGASWDPGLALAGLVELNGAGLAVEVVFPVHPTTVAELPALVHGVAEHLGAEVVITLRRAPSAARGDSAGIGGGEWSELVALSDAIAALPDALPGGARLQFDRARGYAACMLTPPARRKDLLPATGRGGGAAARRGLRPAALGRPTAPSAPMPARRRSAVSSRSRRRTSTPSTPPGTGPWAPSRVVSTPTAPRSGCPTCSASRRGRRSASASRASTPCRARCPGSRPT
jgi:hypothetical protein